MEQHLITIDLDGTTLNNESKVSLLTIQTLRLLDRMGHMVCIVTGRPFRNSKDIYYQIGLQSPMVNFNGALCHFPDKAEWLGHYHNELDKELAFDLFSRQDELGIDMLTVEGKDRLFSSTLNIPDSPFYPKDRAKIELLSRRSLTENPTALAIFCPEEKQALVRDRVLEHYGDQVSIRTWGGILPLLEIVSVGINKAVGVKRIADFYHIPRQKILAFGDENNDLEMLDYAGLGVAMANGTEEVKAIANDVTEYSNQADGLAKYLIKYFDLQAYLPQAFD
ncbi:Cof-type HAD-IIB family hydrolase [Ignavigranum ruoffiae]|uniref:Cof subfamily of IIB subfamily of haloacid dehalogenase superfamily/HAD-superfamily hydrolase, subfamily IIB n=1 Tax=Ignavigranum ruoffiae TaxID=89093 RepID=A0A1H8Z208_9LACT|nr:Cof-type HAD-IIB family hydrolase [Ignavigranum ruoffiae]UPQ85451.1 Cof-type HAD-IIB family hydrolase [Ignavigranum ruoffiae]SEP58381.1 hypothetical protein SAMN04488558_101118 [Ignavigranum ruoffiae]